MAKSEQLETASDQKKTSSRMAVRSSHHSLCGTGSSLTVQIISDFVCPWCLVGAKNLQAALSRFPGGADVPVSWAPFFLNPDQDSIPKGGVPIRQHLLDKYGSGFDFDAVHRRLDACAAPHGFSFTSDRRVVPSLPAHIVADDLLQRFGPAVQNEVTVRLMMRYFADGADISDPAVLFLAAGGSEQARYEGPEAIAALVADPLRVSSVFSRALQTRRLHSVSGVPFFVLTRHGSSSAVRTLSGGQPPEVFLQTFEELSIGV